MSKTEYAIYTLILNNLLASAKTISEEIGKSEKTIYRAIKKLKEMNIIIREGDDYNVEWIVIKQV